LLKAINLMNVSWIACNEFFGFDHINISDKSNWTKSTQNKQISTSSPLLHWKNWRNTMKCLASDISSAFTIRLHHFKVSHFFYFHLWNRRIKAFHPCLKSKAKKLRYRYMSSNRSAARRPNYKKNNPRVKKKFWFCLS
jgi:hypothetical protein